MSNPISTISEYLSYTTNLAGGASFTTDKIQCLEFSSINIILKSDAPITLLLKFSDDGANFDLITTEQYTPSAGKFITSPIVGKWIRIQITNNSGSASTYLRMYSYLAINNTTISAVLQKIGLLSPTVNVDNLMFDAGGSALQTAQLTKKLSYFFTRGTDGVIATGVGKIAYQDIGKYATLGSTSTVNFGMSTGDNIMSVTGQAFGQRVTIYSKTYPIGGRGWECRFNGAFFQGPKQAAPNNDNTLQMLGIGQTDSQSLVNPYTPYSGFYFGYGDQSLTTSDGFGISYYRDDVLVSFIVKGSFNVDKCDGTGLLPEIDFSYLNDFRICGTPSGNILFYVKNPTVPNYGWVLVHVLNTTLSGALEMSFSNENAGFVFYSYTGTSHPVSDNDKLTCGYFEMYTEDYEDKSIANCRFSSFNTKSTLAATDVVIMSIKNDVSWYSYENYTPIIIEKINVYCAATSNISAYLNLTVGGTSFNAAYAQYTPAYIDKVAATLTAITTEICLESAIVTSSGMITLDFGGSGYRLNTGDTISLVCNSDSNSSARVGIIWRLAV